ncbi:unnamed protein product [Dibothriocephalus latus]|uniref:EF-hand domain-containing protein n=1 Tax=Dibothriocephalus latus TaxID=60516 RepID=A0A3P7PG04_DIBLA|nr:unnamed protein product [Dibothriocephalus latus]
MLLSPSSFSSIGIRVAIEAHEAAAKADTPTSTQPQSPVDTPAREGLQSGSQSTSPRRSSSSSKTRKRLSTKPPSIIKPARYIPQQDFFDVLESLDAPIQKRDLRRVVSRCDTNHNQTIDWQAFLAGKNYIKKFYLISAFGKKRKKKKPKGLKIGW